MELTKSIDNIENHLRVNIYKTNETMIQCDKLKDNMVNLQKSMNDLAIKMLQYESIEEYRKIRNEAYYYRLRILEQERSQREVKLAREKRYDFNYFLNDKQFNENDYYFESFYN